VVEVDPGVDQKQPFVVLDQDIMRVAPEQVLRTQVLATYVGGKAVYERKPPVP